MDIDYFNLIEKKLGIKFDKRIMPWHKALKKAMNHKVDVIINAGKIKSREPYLNFTKVYFSIPQAIVSYDTEQDITDLNTLCKKIVAVHKESSKAKYLQKNYPCIKLLEVASKQDILISVATKKAYAGFDNFDSISGNIKKMMLPNLKVIYFKYMPPMGYARVGIRKDKPILTSIIDKAINSISKEERIKIVNKWLHVKLPPMTPDIQPSQTFKLSFQEKEWLSKNHTVTVRVSNFQPYEGNKNGKNSGISVEYIEKILKKYNIKYVFNTSSEFTWTGLLNNISNKEGIDLILAAKITDERKKSMLFTDNYIKAPWVIFTRDDSSFITSLDDLNGKTVAVENNFVMHKLLKIDYPKIKLKITNNSDITKSALKLVATGIADAYVGNLATASYIIKQEEFANLKVASPIKYGVHENAMAIRDDWAPLVSIINRELRNMTTEEKNTIKNKYFNIKYEYGFSFEYLLKWILGIVIFSLIILFVVLKINKHLKIRVKQEVEKNRQQQLLIFQQNRLAQMGELISMIGHQWRQPLTHISVLCSSIYVKHTINKLDTTIMNKFKEESQRQIQYMSKTIDDFRDFFKPNKEKEDFYIHEVITNSLFIIQPIIDKSNIKLEIIVDKDINLYGFKNELGQSIINIINNAKDALQERDVKNKKISISLKKEDTNIILTIKDNAGGIADEIMAKIFDPYFSTKAEKNGTGLGLYMTKLIIEEHMGGRVLVQNDDEGAVFAICL